MIYQSRQPQLKQASMLRYMNENSAPNQPVDHPPAEDGRNSDAELDDEFLLNSSDSDVSMDSAEYMQEEVVENLVSEPEQENVSPNVAIDPPAAAVTARPTKQKKRKACPHDP